MKRTLGRSNIEVSAIGMGCWAVGGPWDLFGKPGGWGEVDDAESIRAIHAALAGGITFFDTAANYGAGHSEIILGKALAGRRGQAVISTKFGFIVDESRKTVTRYEKPEDVIRDARKSCERSLRHMATDYIDLLFLHVWDYPAEHAPAMRDELEKLAREGKIRAYGWSTDSVEAARVFAAGPHCAAVQHDLNVMMDAPEMLALCAEQNLASVNRSPLARGALSGKYDQQTVFAGDDVRRDDWSMNKFFVPTLEKLSELRGILTDGGRTLSQGALGWILARSGKTVPIPGIRTVQQAEENAGAMNLGPLTADQMRQIDRILKRGG